MGRIYKTLLALNAVVLACAALFTYAATLTVDYASTLLHHSVGLSYLGLGLARAHHAGLGMTESAASTVLLAQGEAMNDVSVSLNHVAGVMAYVGGALSVFSGVWGTAEAVRISRSIAPVQPQRTGFGVVPTKVKRRMNVPVWLPQVVVTCVLTAVFAFLVLFLDHMVFPTAK